MTKNDRIECRTNNTGFIGSKTAETKPEFEDISHYQKIIVSPTETDRLMKEIDEVGWE